jgi:hypothetical protein
MFTVYENEINRIKSEQPNYKDLKGIDIDNFFKTLEDSFILLKTMPSLNKEKFREFDCYMRDFKKPYIHEIELGRFIYFQENIVKLARLIQDKNYQDIIRQETKKTCGIIMACISLSMLSLSIFFATAGFYAVFPAVGFFLMALMWMFGTYSELSEKNKYELALTNDVKNLTAPVKNNPWFFDPCYDKSEAESHNEIFNSIGNLDL